MLNRRDLLTGIGAAALVACAPKGPRGLGPVGDYPDGRPPTPPAPFGGGEVIPRCEVLREDGYWHACSFRDLKKGDRFRRFTDDDPEWEQHGKEYVAASAAYPESLTNYYTHPWGIQVESSCS